MQVWNVLHVARWKYRTQKWCKKSPSEHHSTTLSGYIFATKACIDNRKKIVKQQYLLHMPLHYGKLRPTSGWDRFVSLGHPCKFQRLLCLGSVTARHSSSGHQPNVAALNRGRHLYSAGRPSRWALAHILVMIMLMMDMIIWWRQQQLLLLIILLLSLQEYTSCCLQGNVNSKIWSKILLSTFPCRLQLVDSKILLQWNPPVLNCHKLECGPMPNLMVACQT